MRAIKITVAVFGVLFAGVIAWSSYLVLYLNENRGFLEQRFSSGIGREVRIEKGISAKWSLIPTITLEGLWIGNPEWAKGEYFVRAERALVRVDVIELIRKRLDVREITIQGADVLLETASDGRKNWSFGDGDSEIDVRLDALAVKDSRLSHRWPNGETDRMDIPEIRLERAGGEEIDLKARFSYQGVPIKASLRTQPQAVSASGERPFHGEVETPGTSFTVHGRLKRSYELASVEIELRADSVDLSKSVTLKRYALPVTGMLRAIEGRFRTAGSSRDALVSNLSGELRIADAALAVAADKKGDKPTELVLDAVRVTLAPREPVHLETGLTYRKQPYRIALTGGPLADLFDEKKGWKTLRMKASGKAVGKPFEVSGDVGPLSAMHADGKLNVKLQGRQDGLVARLHGRLASPSKMSGSDLNVHVSGPSLSRLTPWMDLSLPETPPFEFDARVSGAEDHLDLKGIKFATGKNDVSGRLRIPLTPGGRFEGELESRSLDLYRLLSPGDQEKAVQDDPVPMMAQELPRDLLDDLNGTLRLKVGRLHLDAMEFEGVDLQSRVDNKHLTLTVTAEGERATVDVALKPSGAAWHLSVRHMSNLELGDLVDRDRHADDRSRSPTTIEADLEGVGKSINEVLASTKGWFTMVLGEGQLSENISSHMPLGDVLYAVLAVINPLSNVEKQSKLECAVIHLDVEKGIATSRNGLAVRTGEMNVLGSGALNLKTGEIDLEFKTAQRKGLGLSIAGVADRYIRLTGTLSEPRVGVNAKSAITHGAAAWATGGLSLLYDTVFRRLTSSGNPCESVSKAIEK